MYNKKLKEGLYLRICHVCSVLTLIVVLGLSGCSSSPSKLKNKSEERPHKRKYKVLGASESYFSKWIGRAFSLSKKTSTKSYFFSLKSGASVDKEIACNLIRTQAAGVIAKRIVEHFVPMNEKWDILLQNEGVFLIKKRLVGLKPIGQYWQEREYFAQVYDESSRVGFSCAVVIEVSVDLMDSIFKELAGLVRQKLWEDENALMLSDQFSTLFRKAYFLGRFEGAMHSP